MRLWGRVDDNDGDEDGDTYVEAEKGEVGVGERWCG